MENFFLEPDKTLEYRRRSTDSIDAVREVVHNILSEHQQLQREQAPKASRGSRLKNKTGINITDMDESEIVPKNTKSNVNKRKKSPTKAKDRTKVNPKRKKAKLNPKRKKAKVNPKRRKTKILSDSDSDKENEEKSESESYIRQQLDTAIEDTASIINQIN